MTIERITTYGRPEDGFVRIVDELRVEDDTLYVERNIKLKTPMERIVFSIQYGDVVRVDPAE